MFLRLFHSINVARRRRGGYRTRISVSQLVGWDPKAAAGSSGGVTAQMDDMLRKRRFCALETNFGSWCSWEALRRWSWIHGQSIRMSFVSADELRGPIERAGRRLLSANVTTRVSSSSAPVQITRLLFWREWQGFYFGLLCHFSYKKKKNSMF